MADWNSYLAERPHRVSVPVQHFREYQYVHANTEVSCWHLNDDIEAWLHQHARDCWVLWEEFRYMNNQDLYEDCSNIEDCWRHTSPYIAFRNAEDAMLFKLTW